MKSIDKIFVIVSVNSGEIVGLSNKSNKFYTTKNRAQSTINRVCKQINCCTKAYKVREYKLTEVI